ncbi:MAG TPA: hypothetical protein VJ323_22600, partial [Bryobacteraceae bacterium]|nr:hypothetical protein [Bryobacteraceae bacterium]
ETLRSSFDRLRTNGKSEPFVVSASLRAVEPMNGRAASKHVVHPSTGSGRTEGRRRSTQLIWQ